MAAWSRVVNAALEDPGAGYGRDKRESGWLCGRLNRKQLKCDSLRMLGYNREQDEGGLAG